MDHQEKLNWILVRGLARETRHWADFPSKLKDRYPESIIEVLELPGVGKKAHLKSETSIEGFVKSLRSEFLYLKEQNPGKWGLIAVSLGGMVGLGWQQYFPEDFNCLITINSSAGNLSLPWERLSGEAIQKIAKLFFKNDLYEREKVILELTTNLTDINDDLVKKWVSFSEEKPLTREVFLKQIFAASRFQVPKQINLPYQIILAEGDRLTKPACSKKLADHFSLPYYSHASAGHDLPLDDPDWLVDSIDQWMKKKGPF